MTQYRATSHKVAASLIAGVQPLVMNSKMLSPDAGLLLILDDGVRQKWVADKDGIVPSTGDWLVQDNDLHVTYVVTAIKFTELFQEV